MSHLRPDERIQRHRKSHCKKGRHEYGESQNVGAGILRRICEVCGIINIDLTSADELETPVIPKKTNLASMAPRESEAT